MSDMDVKAELQEIFRDLFDDDDIVLSDSTSAKDIARWDSLQNVKLMIRIERAFKVKFGTGEVVGLKNVGELLSLIEKKRG
jgi:acyl carrier protein